jgi:hypothetical protein
MTGQFSSYPGSTRQWRKKPVVITAWQWNCESEGELLGVCNCHRGNWGSHLHTMHEGQTVQLEPGDWIIPEPDGEHFYPCKPEVFASIYEAVGAPQPASVAQRQPDREAVARIIDPAAFADRDNRVSDRSHSIASALKKADAIISLYSVTSTGCGDGK